nr:integrase, catalytic region, zinc finger, CCHC-type, peptidase aspartic, catalytic [Tanacetum cinerariifolium]
MKIKESLNVTFDETPPPSKTSPLVDDDLDENEAIKAIERKNLENDIGDKTLEIENVVDIKESRNHPLENIIGNLNQRTLRNKLDVNGVVSCNKARNGKEHGRMMLNSIKHEPLVYGTIEVNGVTRTKTYEELTNAEKLQDDCDVSATNIILQGLPPEVYSLINHHEVQVNTKFLNTLLSEWSKFVTDVKLARTSSNLRNQATIQDGRVIVQQVQGRQGQSFASIGSKSNPRRPRNSAWFEDKILLVQAQEAGQVLDEKQLTFLADPGVAESQDTQITITHSAAFQTDDLDAFDLDCDEAPRAKVVLMANLSSYDSDVIFELNYKPRNPLSRLRAHIATLKGKNVSDNNKPANNVSVIAPGMFRLDLEPLFHRLKNNKEEHEDYLNPTKEHTNTLHGIVEQAEKQNPSDPYLDYALPPKETSQTLVITPNPKVKVYRRRTKVAKSNFFGTVRFGNDHIPKIMGYGEYQIQNVTISRVYYVEGLSHILFLVGQFCDSDLQIAFWKHTCFVHNLEGVDLLIGSRNTNLYTLSLDDMMRSSPIYHMSKALKTKSWLWNQRLSHLNFTTINELAKQGLVRGLPKLKYEKDHLCSACSLEKKAVATARYTQNRSLIRKRHNKTAYELLHDRIPDLKYLHVFDALRYPTNDSEHSVVAPELVDPTGTPSLTSIDQDTQSPTKKEFSDEEALTSGSDDKEYAMAIRNFKKFFRLKGKFVRQPREKKKSFRQRDEKKGKSNQKSLDAVIQIISLAIVQNQLARKIKRPLLKVLGAIAKMTPKTKLTMKLVSWLNRQMR